MSDAVNPYQSPETIIKSEKVVHTQGSLTETMLTHLKGTSPWLRFVGILGFIGSGLTALWGLIFFITIPILGSSWQSIPGLESFGGMSGSFTFFFGFFIFIIAIGCVLIVFFPSLFIYRFGTKIQTFLRTGTDNDLELAFKNNRSLWKFLGILCIVYLAFIPVMIIISIIAGIASLIF